MSASGNCPHSVVVHHMDGCGITGCTRERFVPRSPAADLSAARGEGAVQGFADCEALLTAMALAQAAKELAKAEAAAAGDGPPFSGLKHRIRAAAFHEVALAVQLGQHRTDVYDPEVLATAHRLAAQPSLAAKGGRGRLAAQTPERRREIAKLASDAALTARRARAEEKE